MVYDTRLMLPEELLRVENEIHFCRQNVSPVTEMPLAADHKWSERLNN